MQPITQVVRNLIIINAIFFVATFVFGSSSGLPVLTQYLGAYYPSSPNFGPWQIVTHMFMHGGLAHIFFNMFALYMFGSTLERFWGPKRFLIYYFVCGLGAFFLHEFVNGVQLYMEYGLFFPSGSLFPASGQAIMNSAASSYFVPVVGASGAVFGLLLAFGMLFPNTKLFMIFIPVPIKAKYFVLGYGALELFQAFQNNPGDNVAHFAHLGGMLFGYILLKKWQNDKGNLY